MPNIRLGYVPYLRPGALIFTAIVWRHIFNGATSELRSLEEVYGHVGGRKRNLFGERVLFASKSLFGDSLSPKDVLSRHTLFGIYSRALPQQVADQWAKEIVDGERRGGAHTQIQVSVATKGFRFSTAGLRSCKTCVMQDVDEFGFPMWHLLHALPPIHHCPHHGDVLTTEIKGNIGGNMWKLRLPTGVSMEKQDQRFESASDGYAAYLRLWIDLFEGRLPIIAADSWANCMDRVAQRMGSTEKAIDELSKQLTQSWGSPPDRLPEMLGTHIQHDFVKNELEHRTAPSRIAQKLVILAACDSLGILPAAGDAPKQLNMPLPGGQEGQLPPKEKLLRSALLPTGFPLAIASGLASGHSTLNVGRSASVHRHQVQRAIASIPDSTLEELSVLGSWPVDSWLPKEILRRRRMNAH